MVSSNSHTTCKTRILIPLLLLYKRVRLRSGTIMYQADSPWRGFVGMAQSGCGCGCVGRPNECRKCAHLFHSCICDPTKSSMFAGHFHTHVSVNPCNKGTELRRVIRISSFLFFAPSAPPHLTSIATPPGESWFYMMTRPEGKVWRVHSGWQHCFDSLSGEGKKRFVKKITRVKVSQFCFNCIDDAIYVKRCLCMEIWFVYV